MAKSKKQTINTAPEKSTKTIEIVDQDGTVIYTEDVAIGKYPVRLRHYQLQAELMNRDQEGTFMAREKPAPIPEPDPEETPEPEPE